MPSIIPPMPELVPCMASINVALECQVCSKSGKEVGVGAEV